MPIAWPATLGRSRPNKEGNEMTRLLQIVMFLAFVLVGHHGLADDDDTKFDATGVWDFQTDIAGRKGTLQFVFKQEGNKFVGKLNGQSGETDISGTVVGDKIEFQVPTFGGKAAYQGTIGDRDHMKGDATVVVSKGTWTAKRGLDKPATSPPALAPAGEAGRRVKEFARLLDAGSVVEFKKYAAENFAPSFLNGVPMERHLDFFLATHDMTRGVELHSIANARPNQLTALFKSNLTGRWLTFEVRVEPESPHRVAGLGSRPSNPPAGTQSATKRSDDEIRHEMQSLMKKLADADVFSGTVLLARDGVPIFQGAYGTANKDFNVPNQIGTKFNLGSMNKMFTAVAAAQLVERGKLSFDDPLSKFLPDFPDRASAEKIKIKHLLTHTAGLGGFFSKPWQESSRALYRTVDDNMKRAAADEKLLFEPGTRHRYSNTGMLVVGKVIEIASGQDYYDYVRENITGPAGMLNTDCYELDKVNPNLAVGYEKHYDENGISFRNNLFDHVLRGAPMGGGYSTAEDLLRFDIALRSNKLVGAQYVKLLLSSKPELNSPTYGYGFAIDERQKIAGHGGGFIGINSNLDMFLGTGWTAVVMSNYGRGAMIPQQAMRELVRSERDAAPAAGR
jgi:CubicO group peptidase (beta-lactamase class C family)